MSNPNNPAAEHLSEDYERVAIEACKRGRRGEGVTIIVDVQRQSGGLAARAFLTDGDRAYIADRIDTGNVESARLGISKVLIERVNAQESQALETLRTTSDEVSPLPSAY